MTKAQKEQYVAELVTQLRTLKAAVITEYRGTNVADMTKLRDQLFEKGVQYKIAKNSLLKRAFSEAGITVDDETILDKPIALAIGYEDEVSVAKAITDANKQIESIVPLGGIVNGSFVNANVVITLANLPSREEMYAKIVGGLASLPTRMVRSIANPMTGLVTALNQVKAQKEA